MHHNRRRDRTIRQVRKDVFKQNVTESNDLKKRCMNCKWFDFSAVDLKSLGRGYCKRFPPYQLQIGNRHWMSYDSEHAYTHKNNYCGEWAQTQRHEQQTKR